VCRGSARVYPVSSFALNFWFAGGFNGVFASGRIIVCCSRTSPRPLPLSPFPLLFSEQEVLVVHSNHLSPPVVEQPQQKATWKLPSCCTAPRVQRVWNTQIIRTLVPACTCVNNHEFSPSGYRRMPIECSVCLVLGSLVCTLSNVRMLSSFCSTSS